MEIVIGTVGSELLNCVYDWHAFEVVHEGTFFFLPRKQFTENVKDF